MQIQNHDMLRRSHLKVQEHKTLKVQQHSALPETSVKADFSRAFRGAEKGPCQKLFSLTDNTVKGTH